MSTSGRGTTKNAAATPAEDTAEEISFSDLVPTRQPRSPYPHLKSLDGKRIKILNLGHDGKDDKQGYYAVVDDANRWSPEELGNRYAIPQTIAKKIQVAFVNAKKKNLAYVPANVASLDRGVRLT